MTEHLLKEPVIITTDEHAVLAANCSLNCTPARASPSDLPAAAATRSEMSVTTTISDSR